jgi:predicted RNA methylase
MSRHDLNPKMDIQKEILNATSEYFSDRFDHQHLSHATTAYKALLAEICGQDMDVTDGKSDMEFDNGKALGTFWAAQCLDAQWRTRQFIRGINKAIKERLKTQKTVHILYAGTGPYATLMLPIVLRYASHDIQYTFVEVNPLSFQILKKVLLKSGLATHNITLVKADASKYKTDPKNQPDIVVSETMQNALAKEQQVPIFLNLMTQANNNPVFIPEKIELYIGLKKAGVPMDKPQAKHYHKVESVLEISKASMFSPNRSAIHHIGEFSFPEKRTFIKGEKLRGFDQLVILTEIQVYRDECIGICETGLTTPLFIAEIPDYIKGDAIIDTQYKVGSEPKLDYSISLSSTTALPESL